MLLSEFLLQRITEDEAWFSEHYYFGYMEATARLLADCEAKRRIVDRFVEIEQIAAVSPGGAIVGAMNGLYLAVQSLAAVYADHADYREEWKS